jgi:hypothetical protein
MQIKPLASGEIAGPFPIGEKPDDIGVAFED